MATNGMVLLAKIPDGGWRPTNEIEFINGRLHQRWIGDLCKWLIGNGSLMPTITILPEREWREVPGQERQ